MAMIKTQEEFMALPENARETIGTLARHVNNLRLTVMLLSVALAGITAIAFVALGRMK